MSSAAACWSRARAPPPHRGCRRLQAIYIVAGLNSSCATRPMLSLLLSNANAELKSQNANTESKLELDGLAGCAGHHAVVGATACDLLARGALARKDEEHPLYHHVARLSGRRWRAAVPRARVKYDHTGVAQDHKKDAPALAISILSLFDLVPFLDLVRWYNEGVRWEGVSVPLCTMRYRQKALELSCSNGGEKFSRNRDSGALDHCQSGAQTVTLA